MCDRLASVAPHLFTTAQWRLGSATLHDEAAAWDEVARSLQLDAARFLRLHQVHGADVVVARADDPGPDVRPAADAILSGEPGSAVAVQTADCVPLLMADQRTRVVAAVHGGWRGIALGVARVAVESLRTALGSRPDDLVAAIGPAIGACCYEVGEDVRERFAAAGFPPAALGRWFHERPLTIDGNPPMPGLPHPPRSGHWYFDGWTATRDQLVEAGVPDRQIHIARLCTASHPGLLCSYRREGRSAGRMAAAIRMGP